MIIMHKGATAEQIDAVIDEIKRLGLKADVSKGESITIIGIVGDERIIPFQRLSILTGVKEARMIETPYKLISREYSEYRDNNRIIRVGNVEIGGDKPVYIAGPCAIESRAQLFRIAEEVKKAGAHILRGGIFKPRSSAHSFQGLGAQGNDEALEALSWLHDAGRKYEMPTITEIRGEKQAELIAKFVDILQIGARNMYDQDLLGTVARLNKPVFYKRHFGASVEELLSFSEYIAVEGNKDIILCERGVLPIGKGKNFTRYTLDLGAVPAIQNETYLPVMVDPSHASGRRDLVYPMSCSAIAAGASGLAIEVHYNPAESWVDAAQAITADELERIINVCNHIYSIAAENKKKTAPK
ncbi:MAG: 3-deoxy-7-phosphoheptulonate synthase [Dehalococcoidia bacterium]|nr:3-deoxy-7-phosphoheptulonate synthase [Dehalococcoidia bacterium]